MVLLDIKFQDIIDISKQFQSLSLPALKDNGLKIDFVNDDVGETVYEGEKPTMPFANSELIEVRVVNSRRLTRESDDSKSVYEVTLDIADSNWTFRPGDTIGIMPQNKSSEVEFIISHLNLQADQSYVLNTDKDVKAKVPAHIPVKSTIRHVLTHCVDIRGLLKKLFILALSKHTKDENERRVLEFFCSREGSTSYTMHILNKGLCILDIFTMFKTCKPPIEVLLANLPRLLPRPYSIVNSQLKYPEVIKICFSVMNIGNNRKGLTTSWLEEIILNNSIEARMAKLSMEDKASKIQVYLRKNMTGFSLPEDMSVPLILIGPGTGVSPFIGFLEEREALTKTEVSIGRSWLFFGCRNQQLDFIYEKEMKEFREKGVLDNLTVAFSRVEDSLYKYVQDALSDHGEELVNLIKRGASIFVCGDIRTMAPQIRDVLEHCLVKYDNQTKDEARKFFNVLLKDKKYVVDTWS